MKLTNQDISKVFENFRDIFYSSNWNHSTVNLITQLQKYAQRYSNGVGTPPSMSITTFVIRLQNGFDRRANTEFGIPTQLQLPQRWFNKLCLTRSANKILLAVDIFVPI